MKPYKDECKKPPLGLKPRYMVEGYRLNEISEAIGRYIDDGERVIPVAWIEEYNELINRRNEND